MNVRVLRILRILYSTVISLPNFVLGYLTIDVAYILEGSSD
jgi:ABC-type dipeptide/oligopeptide/nickel transport system permease component